MMQLKKTVYKHKRKCASENEINFLCVYKGYLKVVFTRNGPFSPLFVKMAIFVFEGHW